MIYTAAEYAVVFLEALGSAIIIGGILLGAGSALATLFKGTGRQEAYREARHKIGAGILLGLEVLIGADIIRTVTLDLTFESVGVLAAIVLVRTFLSVMLELEMTGRWPWQGHWRERADEAA